MTAETHPTLSTAAMRIDRILLGLAMTSLFISLVAPQSDMDAFCAGLSRCPACTAWAPDCANTVETRGNWPHRRRYRNGKQGTARYEPPPLVAPGHGARISLAMTSPTVEALPHARVQWQPWCCTVSDG